MDDPGLFAAPLDHADPRPTSRHDDFCADAADAARPMPPSARTRPATAAEVHRENHCDCRHRGWLYDEHGIRRCPCQAAWLRLPCGHVVSADSPLAETCGKGCGDA